MGDEEDGNPLTGDLFHCLQQMLSLALCQHRRRLIEDDELDVGLVDLAGDLRELHVPHGETRHRDVLLDTDIEAVQCPTGVGAHNLHVQGF